MDVRPFDWRDFPALHRNRRYSIFLNSTLLLTRGPLLVSGALLSYLMPSMGVFTCVSNGGEGDKRTLIGQTIHRQGSQFSHLTFVTPNTGLESSAFNGLVEYLMKVSGSRGALRLLADVEERDQMFEVLRRSSFATYTRQRLWRFNSRSTVNAPETGWRAAKSIDAHAVRSLYHNLVPGMVQQIEPLSLDKPHGLIYRQDSELLAYVELVSGHRGIWAQPFVHPDTQNLERRLDDLILNIPNRRSRQVYVCVRSYQPWLEHALEELGAEPGPSLAVMVKHLAVPNKVELPLEVPTIEGSQPEVTASIANTGDGDSSLVR